MGFICAEKRLSTLNNMSRYRINIDNNPPSKAKIDAYKDFDALHKRYKVQSRYDFWRRLYKNPRYFAILVALVSVSVLVYQSSLEELAPQSAFISPPIPPKNIPPIVQDANSEEETVFSYETGTQLYIPPAAFVDSNNHPVDGKIELRYREFRDAADIFIAGIPMEYDSAGSTHTLESAAMLEILAYSDNQPVFLKEGKTLEVEYYSPLQGTDFNVYHLDTTQRNWHFEGKDLVRNALEENPRYEKPELKYILDVNEDTFLTRNVAIPAQKPGRVFQVDLINAKDFGLLKGKTQIVWEFIEVPGFSNPWEEELIPDISAKARAKPYRAAGVFTLEMKGGIKFVAKPLLRVNSLAEAQELYLKKKAAYEKALIAWNAQKAKTQNRMKEQEAARKAYEERLAAWEEEQKRRDSLSQKGTYRKFIIRKLGINQLGRIIDFPLMQIKLELGSEADAKFGQTLYKQGRKIKMIHPDMNTVFLCKADPNDPGTYMVQVDPKRENLLLVSDHEEHLYLLNFRKIPETQSLLFGEGQTFFRDHASLKSLLQQRLNALYPKK